MSVEASQDSATGLYSMKSTVPMYDALDVQGITDKHDVRRWKLFESDIGVDILVGEMTNVKYRPMKLDTSEKVSGRKPTITFIAVCS